MTFRNRPQMQNIWKMGIEQNLRTICELQGLQHLYSTSVPLRRVLVDASYHAATHRSLFLYISTLLVPIGERGKRVP
jgi:hypothetical protein